MSILFAIGVNSNECNKTLLKNSLIKNGFSPAEHLENDFIIESQNVLKSYNYDLDWYYALDLQDSPDLDIIYEIPKEIDKGRLRNIVEIIVNNKIITKIGIFMYDLGTNHHRTYDNLPMEDIKSILKGWYKFGGPDSTVFHLFVRNKGNGD